MLPMLHSVQLKLMATTENRVGYPILDKLHSESSTAGEIRGLHGRGNGPTTTPASTRGPGLPLVLAMV